MGGLANTADRFADRIEEALEESDSESELRKRMWEIIKDKREEAEVARAYDSSSG